MTEAIKKEIREHFERKEYDDIVNMINTKIIVDESNYKDILNETLNILNSIRINRDISYHEDYVEIERKFALYFTERIYSFFARGGATEEKMKEVHRACANFFNAVDSVTSIGGASFNDGKGNKIK